MSVSHTGKIFTTLESPLCRPGRKLTIPVHTIQLHYCTGQLMTIQSCVRRGRMNIQDTVKGSLGNHDSDTHPCYLLFKYCLHDDSIDSGLKTVNRTLSRQQCQSDNPKRNKNHQQGQVNNNHYS